MGKINVMAQLTPEELKSIKDLQSSYNQAIFEIGAAEAQLIAIQDQMLKLVEEKDRIRNFQPPVSGELIMTTFNLQPCAEIGIIKSTIKEAILDGQIENSLEQAFELMLQIGQNLGLTKSI
jgi:hypothetical protein